MIEATLFMIFFPIPGGGGGGGGAGPEGGGGGGAESGSVVEGPSVAVGMYSDV